MLHRQLHMAVMTSPVQSMGVPHPQRARTSSSQLSRVAPPMPMAIKHSPMCIPAAIRQQLQQRLQQARGRTLVQSTRKTLCHHTWLRSIIPTNTPYPLTLYQQPTWCHWIRRHVLYTHKTRCPPTLQPSMLQALSRKHQVCRVSVSSTVSTGTWHSSCTVGHMGRERWQQTASDASDDQWHTNAGC